MKLTILVDNNTIIDRYLKGEPGLSFLIEENGKKILFDTGYSEIFIENAIKMNYDLLDIDYIVFSHSHLDHTWGINFLIKYYTEIFIEGRKYKKPELVTHPDTFKTRVMGDINEIGTLLAREKIKQHFTLNLSKEPFWLTENLVFLGEIARNNDFEAQEPVGKIIEDNNMQDDYVREDSALAYKKKEGIVVITGCSHAGICNIIEKAKKVCNREKIIDVIGGFHLLNPAKKQLNGTLNYMKNNRPEVIHPCHCTDLATKIALANVVNVKEVGVGLKLKY